MRNTIIFVFGCILLLVGIFGLLIGHLGYFVQLDAFQSFLYLGLGAAGLYGCASNNSIYAHRYLRLVIIVNLVLLGLGLTLPNLWDIMHLEIPEHIFHLCMAIAAALCLEIERKKSLLKATA